MIEDIFLVPTEGEFPVAEIETFVEALPHTFRDPENEHVFLVSENDAIADYNRRKTAESPGAYPSSANLIKVFPARIDVSWRLHRLDQVGAFVTWVRRRYEVRVEDEESNDLTANIDALFAR